MLTDDQLERYGRQILMPQFDIAGQERLAQARVLVVGLGGLGSPAALYLAAAGVGHLSLADGDRVTLSNLQRQIAHTTADIGDNKAHSAAASLRAINPEVELTCLPDMLEESTLGPVLESIDLVVDASDNYPLRFALNRACLARSIPLVSGAAVRTEGQVAVFDPARGGPCYRCLYPKADGQVALSCSESGVIAPVVGVVGALQATEAIKVLTGLGEPLIGKLLLLDLFTMELRKLALPVRPGCPDCHHLHD